MGDTVIDTTVKEKDLGITISADMKVSEQCGIAASKGNQILWLIRRNIIQYNIRKYSFSQRTINERNKLSTDCVTEYV